MDSHLQQTTAPVGYPMTDAALERAAMALATATNGGDWTIDYTESQRQVWRDRVARAFK